MVEFDLASLKGRYTRVEDFYIRNHFQAPAAAGTFTLEIGGEVEKPLRMGWTDLQRLPEKQVGSVLECAGDPVRRVSLVSDGLWRGYSFADLVSQANPQPGAEYAHLSGRDGFARSVPAAWLMNGGLLATSLNGTPLSRNHGAPCRALFPGWYGVNSVKWLEKITLARSPLPAVGNTYIEIWKGSSGEFERRPLPPVQVKSVITSPADGAVLHPGKLQISGLAWSGSGPVERVEVSADAGDQWRSATLDAGSSRYDWTRWNAPFEINRRGVVEIVSRAADSAGNVQPLRRDPHRLDFYAYNVCDRIRCIVV